MSSTIQKTKACAGNGCSKDGVYLLKVIYLNKLGWFCESCKNDLVLEGLVIESKRAIGPRSPTAAADINTEVTSQDAYRRDFNK